MLFYGACTEACLQLMHSACAAQAMPCTVKDTIKKTGEPVTYDIITVWMNIHGGSFHKLIKAHEMYRAAGLKSLLLLNSDEPRGLQLGLDVTAQQVRELRDMDVLVVGREAVHDILRDTPARAHVFEATEDPDVTLWCHRMRELHRSRTVQLTSLVTDFHYYDSDYLFLQHPVALMFELERERTPMSRRLGLAREVLFGGNIFYEPEPNRWTSDIRTREDFCQRYGLDPHKPIALWLPDREDGLSDVYGKVMDAAEGAGMNVVTKLHPWEYKNIQHGFDPIYGEGKTSADKWGVPFIAECDSSWAMHFCDVGIVRSSAVGLELPLYNKPVIWCEPADRLRWLIGLYYELTDTCSVWLEDVADLPRTLEGDALDFAEHDYAEVRRRIFTQARKDSFEVLLQEVLRILSLPHDGPRMGSLKPIRRMYLGKLPLHWCRKRHWPSHLWARLRKRLGRNGG